MKALVIALAAALGFAPLLHSQTIQTATFPYLGSGSTRQQDITVSAGQVFKLLTWSAGSGSQVGPFTLKVDGVDTVVALPDGTTNRSLVLSPNFVVAGPRTISLVVPATQTLVCSYILQTDADLAGQNIPSTAVVIPADATGSVQIILESSTDLVTWTAASPGTYGSSTSKRFFRVRAVAQ